MVKVRPRDAVRGFFRLAGRERPRRIIDHALPKSRVKLPDDIEPWPIWRLWLSGKATLDELNTAWSISDVWMANHLLDLQEDQEHEASIQNRRKNKR